jgi:hypothetical protein
VISFLSLFNCKQIASFYWPFCSRLSEWEGHFTLHYTDKKAPDICTHIYSPLSIKRPKSHCELKFYDRPTDQCSVLSMTISKINGSWIWMTKEGTIFSPVAIKNTRWIILIVNQLFLPRYSIYNKFQLTGKKCFSIAPLDEIQNF